jgi:hypothetical protein
MTRQRCQISFLLLILSPNLEHSWREYECMAREYMMYGHPGEDHYIITGTHGLHDWMKGAKREVRVPEYYWKAQCYDGPSGTWAWVSYSQNVFNCEKKSYSGALWRAYIRRKWQNIYISVI